MLLTEEISVVGSRDHCPLHSVLPLSWSPPDLNDVDNFPICMETKEASFHKVVWWHFWRMVDECMSTLFKVLHRSLHQNYSNRFHVCVVVFSATCVCVCVCVCVCGSWVRVRVFSATCGDKEVCHIVAAWCWHYQSVIQLFSLTSSQHQQLSTTDRPRTARPHQGSHHATQRHLVNVNTFCSSSRAWH